MRFEEQRKQTTMKTSAASAKVVGDFDFAHTITDVIIDSLTCKFRPNEGVVTREAVRRRRFICDGNKIIKLETAVIFKNSTVQNFKIQSFKFSKYIF